MSDRFESIGTNRYERLEQQLRKQLKQHPASGDDASTGGAAPGRVGRDEKGEARRADTTSNDGSHLELRRLRLKSWSKCDFSIAETTWPT